MLLPSLTPLLFIVPAEDEMLLLLLMPVLAVGMRGLGMGGCVRFPKNRWTCRPAGVCVAPSAPTPCL